MTTDCFTDLDVTTHRDTSLNGLVDNIVEYGAAAITAIGFVLLLPAAALVMSLLHAAH